MPNFIIPDASERPGITVAGSSAKTYLPGSDTTLPAFTASSSKPTLLVEVKLVQGTGSLSTTASAEAATGTWDSVARSFVLDGSPNSINTLAAALVYTSPIGETGDILFEVVAADEDGQASELCAKSGIKLIASGAAVVNESKGPEATVTLMGDYGTSQLVINNVAVSGTVAFGASLEATAAALVSSINSTASTPDFSASLISGSTFKVTGPSGLGAQGNGLDLIVVTNGNMGLAGDQTLGGGQTSTFDPIDFFKDYLEKPLIGLGSAVAGQVLSNMIFPNTGVVNIKVPEVYLDDGTDDEKIDIAFLYKGRTPNVPVGYDPTTRSYPETWDYTTMAELWTDNPVWCALDYLENKRYGCGNLFRMTSTQRTALYQQAYAIAKWCDELVPDGKGGFEPRFTFNMPLAGMSKIETLQAIASSFHGQFLFPGTGPLLVADMPSEPVLLVNKSSAGKSGIVFRGSGLRSLYNVVNSSWQNPAKLYRREYAYAEDRDSLETYGQRSINVISVGATTARQAIAHAKWVLETDRADPLVASYKAYWDHYKLKVNDILRMHDPKMIRETINNAGGRVLAATTTTLTLDRAVSITGQPLIHVTLPDGSIATRAVTAYDISTHEVTISPALPATPENLATFILGDGILIKVTGIVREGPGEYGITGVYHDPSKYGRIDLDVANGIGQVNPGKWAVWTNSNVSAVHRHTGSSLTNAALRPISETRALLTYQSGTNDRYTSIVTINGTTVSTSAGIKVETADTNQPNRMAVLSTTRAILAVKVGTAMVIKLLALGENVHTVTAAAPVLSVSNYVLSPLSETKFALGWISSGNYRVAVFDTTGDEIVQIGTTFTVGTGATRAELIALSDTTVIASWVNGSSSIQARALGFDGSGISSLGLMTLTTGSMTGSSSTRISADTALIVYSGTVGPKGIAVVWNGSALSASAPFDIGSSGILDTKTATMNTPLGEAMVLTKITDGRVMGTPVTVNGVSAGIMGAAHEIWAADAGAACCRIDNARMLVATPRDGNIDLKIVNR